MKCHKHRCITFFLLILFIVPVLRIFAVNFSDLTLSNDDRLLFRAEFNGQQAVFVSGLADMSIQPLTAFPEKAYLVDNGRTIIALNRFGAMKIPVSGGLPSPLPGYQSFAQGNIPLEGRLPDIAASCDGRWFLHIEPTSPGFGNLLLVDINSGAVRSVSERVELPGAGFPAIWSPDSRIFVYEKGGRLFYFPVSGDLSVLIDERFRMIGQGTIASVLWGLQGDFYYLAHNTLYRVLSPELFTRTIYGDFLSIGNVAAVLPLDFDPGFDRFWIAPDSGSILINKGGKSIFFFLLGENRNHASVLPHVPIPFGAENFNVLWPSSGPLTIGYSLRNQTIILRFQISRSSISPLTFISAPASPNGMLSPDGTRAVFWGENGLELWDYSNWRMIQRLGSSPVFFCAWISDRQLITGNSLFLEEINTSTFSFRRRRITLSEAQEFGFEDTARGRQRILARVGTDWFATDGTNAWAPAINVQTRQGSLSSDRFRVFLDPRGAGRLENSIMIRNMQSTGTVSLFSEHTANSVYAGNPSRYTQIALCFDLYDDDTGLPDVLSALRRHNIRATFFLNGEFIRRSPLAASAIADAGHEIASLFYAPIDLSDAQFRVTHDFITRGLARNEDEFNRATGRELSLLWHAPFFRTSGAINAAALNAGYVTVSRTIDPGDWMSKEDSLRLNLRQTPPAEIIEQIINRKESGDIIPLRLGRISGGRDEYLFQRIDVLLDALLRSGCTIVPVSAVIR